MNTYSKPAADFWPEITVPSMNISQMWALWRKFNQNPDGSPNFMSFMERAQHGFDCLMLHWCGMWLGVETDGYTHS